MTRRGVGVNVWIIIPVFNEEESLPLVLRSIPHEFQRNIVVVDNGSTDATPQKALEHGAVLAFEPRRGYGYACLAGITALPNDCAVVVFLDGDYSDVPEEMMDGAVAEDFKDVIRSEPASAPMVRFGGNYDFQKATSTGCILCLDSCAAGITSNAAWGWGATWSENKVQFYGRDDILPADGTPVVLTFSVQTAAATASNTWYFAEGYTGAGFQEYLTLQNPNPTAANVTVEYTCRSGAESTQNITVSGNSRQTVDVNLAVGPNEEVSAIVTSDQPIVAERPMYFNSGGIEGGHDYVGSINRTTTYHFAEGYTGDGFQQYLILQNNNANSATVTVTYTYRSGAGKTQTITVDPNSRATVDVNAAIGRDKEVSMQVTSNLPIVAERPMYFCFGDICDGHDVVGFGATP